jgi:hypothetical protein
MRLLTAVFACVIVAAFAVAVAPAEEPANKQKKTKPVKRTRKPESKTQPPASLSRQQVYIDPQTGEFREGPAGAAVGGISGRASATAIINEKDGSITALLGSEHTVYAVATLNPDGTVSQSHQTAAEREKANKRQKSTK